MAKKGNKSSPEFLLVFNPQASGAHRAQLLRLINEYFSGRKVDLCEISDEDDVKALLEPWLERGVHLVVAAGGDGTISTVAGALVNSNVPLGILPMGTGNVLARELDLPLKTGPAAELLAGRFGIRRLDAMRVGDRVFVLGVSVGLSAMTMRRTRRRDKKRFGRVAYLWAFLLNLFGLPQHSYVLEVDGRRMEVRANELIVVNVGMIGYKALRWGPDVEPDDGRLDLCFVRTRSAWDFLRVLWDLLSRQKSRGPYLKCVEVLERVVIHSPEGILVQGDGDMIGRTPVEIILMPASLKVAVPDKS